MDISAYADYGLLGLVIMALIGVLYTLLKENISKQDTLIEVIKNNNSVVATNTEILRRVEKKL